MKHIFVLAIMLALTYKGFSQEKLAKSNLGLHQIKDSTELRQRITQLVGSSNEKDLQLLADYYRVNKDTARLEGISKLMVERFPYGKAAFTKEINDIYDETDAATKAKKYNNFVLRFGNIPEFQNDGFFRAGKIFVALAFADKQPDMVKTWLDKIPDSFYRTSAYSYGARKLAEFGHYGHAEQLITLAIVRVKQQGLKNLSDSTWYLEFARMAAGILLAEKKYAQGYTYAKDIYTDVMSSKPKIKPALHAQVANMFVNYQVANEDYAEAFPVMAEQIRAGTASLLIKERFRKAYKVFKGSDRGYDKYYASLISGVDKR